MSITDELREFRRNAFSRIDPMALKLLEITNRIDAEHEAQVADAFDTRNSDENLEADGWVKLPVDADGVPIRIGDKVTEHEDGHTFKVDGFMDWGGEWWVFMRGGIQAPASKCTHYCEPTTEDVLTELEGMRGGYATYEDVVMRCAELAAILRKRWKLGEVDE